MGRGASRIARWMLAALAAGSALAGGGAEPLAGTAWARKWTARFRLAEALLDEVEGRDSAGALVASLAARAKEDPAPDEKFDEAELEALFGALERLANNAWQDAEPASWETLFEWCLRVRPELSAWQTSHRVRLVESSIRLLPANDQVDIASATGLWARCEAVGETRGREAGAAVKAACGRLLAGAWVAQDLGAGPAVGDLLAAVVERASEGSVKLASATLAQVFSAGKIKRASAVADAYHRLAIVSGKAGASVVQPDVSGWRCVRIRTVKVDTNSDWTPPARRNDFDTSWLQVTSTRLGLVVGEELRWLPNLKVLKWDAYLLPPDLEFCAEAHLGKGEVVVPVIPCGTDVEVLLVPTRLPPGYTLFCEKQSKAAALLRTPPLTFGELALLLDAAGLQGREDRQTLASMKGPTDIRLSHEQSKALFSMWNNEPSLRASFQLPPTRIIRCPNLPACFELGDLNVTLTTDSAEGKTRVRDFLDVPTLEPEDG